MAAYTTVVTHATGDVFPATDWNSYVRDDFAFLHDQGADLPSGATITPTNQTHRVTGVVTITAIAAPTGTGQGGNRVLLKFQAAGCAITAGAALVLTGGPFVSQANSCIEFVWDATLAGWVEIGRTLPQLRAVYTHVFSPGTANITTTSASFVALDTTNLRLAGVVADGQSDVLLEAFFPAQVNSMVNAWFSFLRGGVEITGLAGGLGVYQGGGQIMTSIKGRDRLPAAGTYNYDLACKSSGTTAGIAGSTNTGGAEQVTMIATVVPTTNV